MILAPSSGDILDDVRFLSAKGQPVLIQADARIGQLQRRDHPANPAPDLVNRLEMLGPLFVAVAGDVLLLDLLKQRPHILFGMNDRNHNERAHKTAGATGCECVRGVAPSPPLPDAQRTPRGARSARAESCSPATQTTP